MTTRKKPSPKSFKVAYQILKTNAENLQNSDEPDIDNLMQTVEQSIDAYKVCQARIEAVQRALDAAFDADTADDVAQQPDSIIANNAMQEVEASDDTLATKASLEQESVDADDDKQTQYAQEDELQEDEQDD